MEGQKQLNQSLQAWSAVRCYVVSVCVWLCVCAHLAVNQRETLALHRFLHSSNVAG